jgi:hypothetical protein
VGGGRHRSHGAAVVVEQSRDIPLSQETMGMEIVALIG